MIFGFSTQKISYLDGELFFLDLAPPPRWVTKYCRCKDFDSKEEEIYKINNITKIIQCPGLKTNQSVV